MGALVKVRSTYEATPRAIEGELVRKARGDRGCLGDAISATGALLTVGCGLMAAFQVLPLGFAFVGIAVLVAGFVTGAVSQTRSGKERSAALKHGPLVAGLVLHAEPHLREMGRRSGRATVLFTTDEDRRFDERYLGKAARRITHRLSSAGAELEGDWVALARGSETFGFAALPASLGEGAPLWVGDVVVYPDQLPEGRLEGDPAMVAIIVDPDRRFVEHV